MPREGVPYPERVLCSLKNTIAMIEQKLGLKIEKINGVGSDPQGNVTLVSGDAALTIEEDATQHQVTIGLDRAELPTAAVTSVNGETGAVQLNASEIPGKGVNKTVMDNINTLETVGLQMRSDLNDEITARGNADAALQNNINTLQASIPSAAADAVAADPTVAQLVAEMDDKVDISDVSTGEVPNTIAKRNGNGQLYAADPAYGATDKTLVTANWVSQTGDVAPNNLMHKTGNESRYGRLTLINDRLDYDWNIDMMNPPRYSARGMVQIDDNNNNVYYREETSIAAAGNTIAWTVHALDANGNDVSATLMLTIFRDGTARLQMIRPNGYVQIVPRG